MKKLLNYLKDNKIEHNKVNDVSVCIAGKVYDLIQPTEGVIFDDEFNLVTDETENDGFVYKFGGKYYYESAGDIESPKLNPLKYIGTAKEAIQTDCFLGVRGQFELLNGSRGYADWVKKATFLGVKSLGICEKNTLAGALKFQLACNKAGITPIIGMTVTVWRPSTDLRYDVKCYVKNSKGWENLLLINKELNVENIKFIKEEDFLSLTSGLIMVVDPKSLKFEDIFPLDIDTTLYYQLDTIEYESNDTDKEYLLNLKNYVNSEHRPVAITDAFYLDREDAYIKQVLNKISNIREYKSPNQYFKSKEDYFFELDMLFGADDSRFEDIFKEAVNNEIQIAKQCKFNIETGHRHLPEYELTDEQKAIYKDKNDMFWSLLDKGIEKKVPKDKIDEYINRIETEYKVISLGGVMDYFLILWDIIDWSTKNDILVGVGRGSAGGSLIAYLLDITQLDPLKYGLLFERFLNVGRVQKSLPDIDTDFQGERRDDVKRYMERRFGELQVCSIGTYTTLKTKQAIKDLSRQKNIDYGEVNYITSVLDIEKEGLTSLIRNAVAKKRVKNFVKENSDVVNELPLVLHQPKSSSIHACATLILPKEKDIFRWIPVKKMTSNDGSEMLVSEWEGGELDSAGFLKEDILGIIQLDKFKHILDSIKAETGKTVDIYNLPDDDKKVFEYFRKGWNGDVFHFGSSGLSSYCQDLKPENMEDLIAGISLYRPGAMENNFHNEYVSRKEGRSDIEYLWGCKDITKNTLGLVCYQEQVMRICSDVGGFTLMEADDVRKAMGKKVIEILDRYSEQFVNGAVAKGCPKEEAVDLWNKLEKFAGYGFNRSHAVAYALTGYISQWLKVYYPLHFWKVAFRFCSEDAIPNYISEVHRSGAIKILPPDINKSGNEPITDFSKGVIYWGLSSIKQVGEKATEQLITNRNNGGEYFSFDEFLDRNLFKGSKVNKSTIENLILSGAFDGIEDIQHPIDRITLIGNYRDRAKVKLTEDDMFKTSRGVVKEWWWIYQQKLKSGVAFFNYEEMASDLNIYDYCSPEQFNQQKLSGDDVTIAGYVVEMQVKSSRKGSFARIKIENNYNFMDVIVWAEQFAHLSGEIENCEKSLLFISGNIRKDNRSGSNVLQSNGKTKIVCLR